MVAKLRSPFRYPGAKTKIADKIISFMDSSTIIDPFVGGGSVMCAALTAGKSVVINDFDENVSAFWHIVFGDKAQREKLLVNMNVHPTVEMFREIQGHSPTALVDMAFKAIFLNRCSFSGISIAGPIGGNYQRSKYAVSCRYNYERLVNQIEALAVYSDQVRVLPVMDFEGVLSLDVKGGIYLDPPYVIQGNSLYACGMERKDHDRLAKVVSQEKRHWLLSYDDCPYVSETYKKWFRLTVKWTYENTHKVGTEVLISNRSLQNWGDIT